MANWNGGTLEWLSKTWGAVETFFQDLWVDAATWFEGTTSTNLPNKAKRWNAAASRFESWNTTTSTWEPLATTYSIDVTSLDGEAGSFYLDLTNATGILPSARFDNTSHGNRGGGTLHALATGAAHGFMPSSDKAKLDAATSNAAASTVMMRDGSGRAKVAAPSVADDIARKQETDNVQSNLNTHTAGTPASGVHGMGTAASRNTGTTAGTLVLQENIADQVPTATATVQGKVEKATQAEVDGGTADKYPDAALLNGWTMSQAFKIANKMPVVLREFTVNNVSSIILGDQGEIDNTFLNYRITITSATFDTNDARAFVQTSKDGGTTFDAGSSDYDQSAAVAQADTFDSKVDVTLSSTQGDGLQNTAGYNYHWVFNLFDPSNTSLWTLFRYDSAQLGPGFVLDIKVTGVRREANKVDAFKFYVNTGLIVSAHVKLEGIP